MPRKKRCQEPFPGSTARMCRSSGETSLIPLPLHLFRSPVHTLLACRRISSYRAPVSTEEHHRPGRCARCDCECDTFHLMDTACHGVPDDPVASDQASYTAVEPPVGRPILPAMLASPGDLLCSRCNLVCYTRACSRSWPGLKCVERVRAPITFAVVEFPSCVNPGCDDEPRYRSAVNHALRRAQGRPPVRWRVLALLVGRATAGAGTFQYPNRVPSNSLQAVGFGGAQVD